MADYINLDKYCATICRCNKNYCSKTSCYLLRAKAEDVAPVVHGEWKKYAGNLVFCSVCGYKYLDYIECDNYCGNCGAKMIHEL